MLLQVGLPGDAELLQVFVRRATGGLVARVPVGAGVGVGAGEAAVAGDVGENIQIIADTGGPAGVVVPTGILHRRPLKMLVFLVSAW